MSPHVLGVIALRSGWTSDGQYRREETLAHTFTDGIGAQRGCAFRADADSSVQVPGTRGILDWFKEQR